jgi:hypothetical protein
MKTARLALPIIFAAIVFAGCSQPLSVDDGEKIFHNDFDFKARGNVKLVSFTKSNSQEGEIKNQDGMTVKSCSMQYNAEVEAIQRCVLSLDNLGLIYAWGETNEMFNLYGDLQPEQIGHGPGDIAAIKMNSGQRCIIGGTIIFEKSEKGWAYHKSRADFLQPEILQ